MQSEQRHTGSSLLFHLGALFTVAVWGESFVSTAVLLGYGLGPVEIYVYRFALAYLIMLLIDHRQMIAHNWRDEFSLLLCGLTSGSIYYISENSALEFTLAADVSLITALAPLITALLIGFIYKSERPSAGTWVGSVIAFIGVGCIIIKDDGTGASMARILGDLLALAAAMSWAIYSIVLRRISANYSTTFITRKTLFYGVITALPFMALEDGAASLSTLSQTPVWTNLLFLGIVASLICFFLWSTAVKRLGAITASNYLYFSPIITLIAAWIVLGEKITIMGYVGCTLVIGGLILGDYLSLYMRRINLRH